MSAPSSAWLVEEIGSPWSVRLAERPVELAADGEVVVKTAFSALNFADGLMLEGKYQVRRCLLYLGTNSRAPWSAVRTRACP